MNTLEDGRKVAFTNTNTPDLDLFKAIMRPMETKDRLCRQEEADRGDRRSDKLGNDDIGGMAADVMVEMIRQDPNRKLEIARDPKEIEILDKSRKFNQTS